MKELLCVRCAREGKTCCQRAEIFITKGDAARIAGYCSKDDFFEFRYPDNPAYLDQDDDPIWKQYVFRQDGHRRVIKRDPVGNCAFLRETGCILPLEVRPLVCRLYPFEYNAEGIEIDVEGEWCPGHLMEPGESFIQALDMSVNDAEGWHCQLYAEIQEEAKNNEHRFNL